SEAGDRRRSACPTRRREGGCSGSTGRERQCCGPAGHERWFVRHHHGNTTEGRPDPPTEEQRPAALDPQHRTFIVSTILTEQAPDGSDCSLSPGDVVTRIDDSPDDNKNVKVLVSSSQKGDCNSGSQVAIAVDDLQEMHNHFREQLDQG